MDAIEVIHARRSIRDYQARDVDRAIVEDILWDAAQAPTTPVSGRIPFTFVVIAGVDRLADYGARALLYAREHRGPGPAFDWVDRPDFSVFFNAPVAIVICGFEDGYGQAVQDCNRAGQNLMLSAHARGLGTCWVGSPMAWLRDAATRAELGIPESYPPCAVLTLGYIGRAPTGTPRGRPPVIWA